MSEHTHRKHFYLILPRFRNQMEIFRFDVKHALHTWWRYKIELAKRGRENQGDRRNRKERLVVMSMVNTVGSRML